MKLYPLAVDPTTTLKSLCAAYRITMHQAKYAIKQIGIPRSLKNYRKGRGL